MIICVLKRNLNADRIPIYCASPVENVNVRRR